MKGEGSGLNRKFRLTPSGPYRAEAPEGAVQGGKASGQYPMGRTVRDKGEKTAPDNETGKTTGMAQHGGQQCRWSCRRGCRHRRPTCKEPT